MKRRQLLATALATPVIPMATGCASPAEPGSAANAPRAQITVLYDAFGREGPMQRDWGYAAFIEMNGKRVLFDTGNDAEILARNAAAAKVDLSRLDFVVMSHRHGDHMGGMSHLLAVNPKVRIYAPKEGFGVYGADLPSSFYRKDDTLPPEQRYYGGAPPTVMRFGSAWPRADLVLVDKPTQPAPGFHLVSLVSDKPGTLELRELSLVIESPAGLAIVVGCSHPGLDNILKAAAAIGPDIRFVVGGFHFVVAKDGDIDTLVTTLRDTYKVAFVAPGHCTGEPTFAALRKAFGDRYLYAGLGTTLSLAGEPRRAVGDPPGSVAQERQGYAELYARATARRSSLFTRLASSSSVDGGYLGQWRRSMIGCC